MDAKLYQLQREAQAEEDAREEEYRAMYPDRECDFCPRPAVVTWKNAHMCRTHRTEESYCENEEFWKQCFPG